MAEQASAYVTLIPSAKGFGRKTEQALGGELPQVGERQGKSLGGKVASGFGTAFKRTALGVAAAGGTLIGAGLVKGFQRLNAIDQAEAKLSGLGHSAATVDKIMDNALKSVKGTAFGLGDAANVAASAVAAGVKPGKDLERTLKLVGDAATIGGTSLEDMGAIFGKVAATGKVNGEVIQQLGERGIPILQLLGKELGKTPAEVSKLASKGKIDFDTFRDAMESGLGGAAQKSGKTFSGAFANMQAALGRLGASALKGVFPKLQGAFSDITVYLDKAGPYAEKFGKALGDGLSKAGKYVGPVAKAIGGLFSGGKGSKQMTEFVKTLKSVFEDAKAIVTDAISIIQSLWARFGGTITTLAKSAFGSVLTILRGAFTVVRGIFQTFSALLKGDWSGVWEGIKAILSGAWTVIKGLVSAGWALIKAAFAAAGSVLKSIFSNIWDGVKSLAAAGIKKVVDAVKALPGKIRDIGGLMKDAGKALADKFMSGLKNIAGKAGDIAKGLWNGVKSFLNSAIDKINQAIPNKLGVGKLSVDIPDNPFPHFAKGGYIPARPGGTLAVLAEAGEGEYAVPESKMHALLASVAGAGAGRGGGLTQNNYFTAQLSEEQVATMAARKLQFAMAR